MEYLVSAEYVPYQQWQLELLIESFKYHKCENKLLVCLSQTNEPPHPFYIRNIAYHENKFTHNNIGKIRGFDKINNVYDLYLSVLNNKIKQPFASIPLDIVLKRPLEINFTENPEIIFLPDPFFTFEETLKEVGDYCEIIEKDKSFFQNNWIPIGPLMIFNKIPTEIFERNVALTEKLAIFQLKNKKNIWKYTDRLAWCINLCDYLGKIVFKGDYSLTMNMLENSNAPFIHYEHGLPPVFNKLMFQYTSNHLISLGDPFEILAANSPTENSHFISNLAKKSIENREQKEK